MHYAHYVLSICWKFCVLLIPTSKSIRTNKQEFHTESRKLIEKIYLPDTNKFNHYMSLNAKQIDLITVLLVMGRVFYCRATLPAICLYCSYTQYITVYVTAAICLKEHGYSVR